MNSHITNLCSCFSKCVNNNPTRRFCTLYLAFLFSHIYPVQYAIGFPFVCHQNKVEKKFAILYTSSKYISQLENTQIITCAYFAEANAVHSIHNS